MTATARSRRTPRRPAAVARVVTPVEERAGLWLKREDAHRLPCGVNGSKLRACQHLIGTAVAAGATSVISAASVNSPQNAMAAAVARDAGVPCRIIVGGTNPDAARRHRAVAVALDQGATLAIVPVGYNPYLQSRAAAAAAATPGAYHLTYGIAPPPDAKPAAVAAFHAVGADQVRNLPPDLRTLVIPFGSGNTAATVLYGLHLYGGAPARIVLVGIGPDRRAWLAARLAVLGVDPATFPLEHLDLHGTGYATYGQKMPETLDGVALHPTYEGKVARYLNERRPAWWTARDGSTCLWIVGGPL